MSDILTLPDERLRQKSEAVATFDDALLALVARLEQAMLLGPGGVGIAAPQLGVLQRVVIVDCALAQRPCKNHGRLVMINPEIVEFDGEVLGREGCLSVPEWVGTVPRARNINVRYQDSFGQLQQIATTAFEARVIQHEIDHLDGVLFIDRIVSTSDMVRRMKA